jgi:hypothetical protein
MFYQDKSGNPDQNAGQSAQMANIQTWKEPFCANFQVRNQNTSQAIAYMQRFRSHWSDIYIHEQLDFRQYDCQYVGESVFIDWITWRAKIAFLPKAAIPLL